jgi:hypothetical protein
MVMIDDEELAAGAAHGGDWSLAEQLLDPLAAADGALELAPFVGDGPHADGHLGRPQVLDRDQADLFGFCLPGLLSAGAPGAYEGMEIAVSFTRDWRLQHVSLPRSFMSLW